MGFVAIPPKLGLIDKDRIKHRPEQRHIPGTLSFSHDFLKVLDRVCGFGGGVGCGGDTMEEGLVDFCGEG